MKTTVEIPDAVYRQVKARAALKGLTVKSFLMEMILDTNAVSALFRGSPNLIERLRGSARHHLPAIVLGEYRYGLLASKLGKDLGRLLDLLERQSFVLAVDQVTARHYAQIRGELRQAGRPIPEHDLWIAALARQHGLPIVSQEQHFSQVAGLERVGW